MPSNSVASVSEKKESDDHPETNFYNFLDQYTITDDGEVLKIDHEKMKDSEGHKYLCIKCGQKSKYFSLADRHYDWHCHQDYRNVREALSTAEFSRANDAKESHHEK